MSAQEKTVNDWSWWSSALAGDRQELPDRAPQPGFYRAGQRALAIWYDDEDGSLAWNLTGTGWQPQHADEVTDLYGKACMYPIPQEVWGAIDEGQEWPPHLLVDLTQADLAAKVAWHPAWAKKRFDERQQAAREKREAEQRLADEAARIEKAKDVTAETEAAGAALQKLGHNSGEPHLVARDALNAILEAFKAWHDKEAHGAIETEAQNLKALGWQQEAQRIRIDAKKTHTAEKEPHLKAAREVDARWITGEDSITSQAKALEDLILKMRTPFEVAEKKRKADEVEAKRKADAEAAAAAEAARKAAGPIPSAQFELTAPAPKRQAAAPRGRVATKTVERVVFDDPSAVFAFLGKIGAFQLDATDIAMRHVRRQIDNGVTVPGARIITEEVAR